MKGQLLAVDFENKKLLNNTQPKSESKSDKHCLNHTLVCDGAVTLFTTKASGGIWQMRMRVKGHRQYFRKSLRTKDKASAIEKATYEHAQIFVIAELESESDKATKKYWKVYDKIYASLEKKQIEEIEFWKKVEREQAELDNSKKRTRWELLNDKGGFDSTKGYARVGNRTKVDYLSYEHIREAMLKEGYLKTYEERTKRKRYIRTHTHRLIAKAEANIKAVEKGTFGVGH